MCIMRQINFSSVTKTESQSFRIHYELNYMARARILEGGFVMQTGMILEIESTVTLRNNDGRVAWLKLTVFSLISSQSTR